MGTVNKEQNPYSAAQTKCTLWAGQVRPTETQPIGLVAAEGMQYGGIEVPTWVRPRAARSDDGAHRHVEMR
jgi:hypothetical protein